MRDGNFRPPTESTPLDRSPKIGTGDYVGGPYGCAKFGTNPVMGLLGKWVKYNELFFIYTFFSGTHLQVRPIEGFLRFTAQTTRTRGRMCILGFR